MLPQIAIICGLAAIDYISSPVLFRSKWFNPYFKGKPTLPNKYYKASGAYVIKNKNTGQIKYVGHSGYNLKKTLYRHFQKHNDTQTRHVYNPKTHRVVIFRTSPTEAYKAEKKLIYKYRPTDNEHKYPDLFTPKKLDKIQKYWRTVDLKEIPF